MNYYLIDSFPLQATAGKPASIRGVAFAAGELDSARKMAAKMGGGRRLQLLERGEKTVYCSKSRAYIVRRLQGLDAAAQNCLRQNCGANNLCLLPAAAQPA